MENKIISLSIVEDRSDMLNFLKNIFDNTPDFSCKNTYTNAEDAILFLPKSSVDVAIVDIGLPGKSGIECVRRVKELRPDIQFMMYTIFEQDNNIFESLKAGASGYLIKSTNKVQIESAVRELVAGGAPMSPSIARKVAESFRSENHHFKDMKLLGKRENEVLTFLAKGLLYKEIADKMGITIGTVKQHIHKIYQKLHVANRTEAINRYWGND